MVTKANRSTTAKMVAAKIAETVNSINGNNPQEIINNSDSTVHGINGNVALDNIAVPGLQTLTPQLLAAMIPAFHSENYHIHDALNPSESIPQITQLQADKATTIYDGAIRALQVTGKALDVTKERFTVEGKKAKAVGAGISASTDIEKVKGLYLGYLSELENTHQKNVELGVNQAKSVTTARIAAYSKDELQSQERLAASKAEMMRLKDVELQAKLNEFKQSLGYLKAGN